MPEITIVGAGLSGLIAAIELAEKGARVVLHEAGSQPGGRARTDASAHRVNLGPHALYRRGAFGEWLTLKGLRPSVHFPSLTGMRFRQNGRVRRRVAGLLRLPRSARKPAPMEESYRDWATREFGPDFSKLAIGFASLPTYHPDPGVLSAAFVQERIARSVQWRPVWYIRGGWIKLIEKLVARAEELGTPESAGISFKSTEAGAATQIWAATADLADHNGAYLADCQIGIEGGDTSATGFATYLLDDETTNRLWTVSEGLVGAQFPA